MKGKFDAYVLWPLAKKSQNWIVDRSAARDFTVSQLIYIDQINAAQILIHYTHKKFFYPAAIEKYSLKVS